MERSEEGNPRCKAHNRSGQQCGRPAMNGQKVCRQHGGLATRALANAKRKLEADAAREAVATYGLPREVMPQQALLEELHRTAGHVAWLGIQLNETARLTVGEEPSVWVKLYQAERKHFADVAKTCIQAGIEERRVRIAEEQGRLIAQVIRGILNDLDVADRPEVPDIVRKHLTLAA